MKKNLIFTFCAIFGLSLLISCGSSRKASTPGESTKGTQVTPYGLEMPKTQCEILAEQSPGTRAYGEATNFRESYAKAYAELQARAQMARAINNKIRTAQKESGISYNEGSASNIEGQTMTDEDGKSNISDRGIAEEVVSNAVIIHTDKFIQPNRQYHVYVCLEYQGTVSDMAKEISEKVKHRIPDEERLKMEYEFRKFEEEIEKELSKSADR